MSEWNPWHGCTKISPGCLNCYMYRRDEKYGLDASVVKKTQNFNLPLKKKRDGSYKLTAEDGIVYTCFTSDFLHPEADPWREEAWEMMKIRKDLEFLFITKRPERLAEHFPEDWGDGYDNVHICCTCENQKMADKRLPIFLELPIKHKSIIHEPMLEVINIRPYLERYGSEIAQVLCGGESGEAARLCDFEWVLSTMNQCVEHQVPFTFRQTGAVFRKGSRIYQIPRKDQMGQARKAGIDYIPLSRGSECRLEYMPGE